MRCHHSWMIVAVAFMLSTTWWALPSPSTSPLTVPAIETRHPVEARPEHTPDVATVHVAVETVAPVESSPHSATAIKAERGPNDILEWVQKLRGEGRRVVVEEAAKRSLDTIREGNGIDFRSALEFTAADNETRLRHHEAMERGASAYFDMLADTPVPLIPWKKTARPIVCHGLDYYSGHFSIPGENIVPALPEKTRDWATVVPGRKETYIFKSEGSYRKDLEESRFGITRRRYGFATNRNLEMLAAGCVPFFCGIHRVPTIGTLDSLPKGFLRMMTRFPGVSAKCYPPRRAVGYPIERSGFNDTKYTKVAEKLLDYTRRYQTTSHLAKYILSATSLKTLPRNVLVLWASHYTIFLTGFLHGLRTLGVEVEDVPRRDEVYAGPGCPIAQHQTYAKGWFFFCRTQESPNLRRTDIEARIRARSFDLVVISVTDTLTYHLKDPSTEIPFYDAIVESYPKDLVLALNDADLIRPMTADVAHKKMHNSTLYFKRETHGCHEVIW